MEAYILDYFSGVAIGGGGRGRPCNRRRKKVIRIRPTCADTIDVKAPSQDKLESVCLGVNWF